MLAASSLRVFSTSCKLYGSRKTVKCHGNLARHVGPVGGGERLNGALCLDQSERCAVGSLNGFNTVACMVAMALTVWKRRRFSHTDTRPSFASSPVSLSGRLAE